MSWYQERYTLDGPDGWADYLDACRALRARPPAEDTHAACLWMGAFMDALLGRHPLSLIRNRQGFFHAD